MKQYNSDMLKIQRLNMRDLIQRGISLLLALIMLFPTGVFAAEGDYAWYNTYKQALMTQIMSQKEDFLIEYKGKSDAGEYFVTIEADKLFRQLVDESKIPAIYGPVNIVSKGLVPVMDNGALKSIRHLVEYHNTKEDFDKASNALDGKFKEIVLKYETPYERIEAAYDYLKGHLTLDVNSKDNIIEFDNDGNIKKDGVSQGVYAILFSIMMDKMGYENHIVVGVDESKVYNKVMFQGNLKEINISNGEFLENIKEPTKNQLEYEIKHLVDQITDTGLLERLKAVAEEFEVEVSAKKLNEIKTRTLELEMEIQKYVTKKQVIEEKAEMVDIDLDYGELDKVINGLNSKMKGIEKRIAAKDAIEKAKASKLQDDIHNANDLVKGIGYVKVRTIFEGEIEKIVETIYEKNDEKIKEKAEELVDQAEIKVIVPGFNSDTEYDPKEYDPTAALYINAAKTQISKIKAPEHQLIKLELDARLKDIEAVQKAKEAVAIAQIKRTAADVKKAEGLILAISNVRKSEPKDVEIIAEYKVIREELLKELKKLEAEVTTTIDEANAVKAVELAEKTLKRGDYDKAIGALDKIDTINDENIGKELKERLEYAYDVILAVEAIENAEKIMREKAVLSAKVQGALDDAEVKLDGLYDGTELDKILDNYIRYSPTIKSLKTRIKTVNTVKEAIIDVETVEDDLKILVESIEDIKENVIKTRANIDKEVSDSKIKKELNTRLDNILSDLDAIEKVEKAEDIQSEHITGNLVDAIKDAEAAVKKVKTESIKSQLDNRIKIVKGIDLISKVEDAIENAKYTVAKAEGNSNKDNVTAAKKAVADAKKAIVAAENAIKLVTGDNKYILTIDLDRLKIEVVDGNNINIIDRLEEEIRYLEQKIKDDAEEVKVSKKTQDAVNKAKGTFPKTETTIKSAITAVAALKNRYPKNDKISDLEKDIESLFIAIKTDAEDKVKKAINSIADNSGSLKKDVADAQKAVNSVNNLAGFAYGAGLKIDIDTNYNSKYGKDIEKLNNIINAINASMDAIKLIESAEKLVFDKYTTTSNATTSYNKAEKAITNIKDDSIKDDIRRIIEKLESRLGEIKKVIDDETTKEKTAKDAVLAAENIRDEDDLDGLKRRGKINEAREIIETLLDTNLRKSLEARIKKVEDSIRSQEELANIRIAEDAVSAAEKAINEDKIKLFPEENSDDIGKRGYYDNAVSAVFKVTDKEIRKRLEARLKKVEEKLKALEDEVYVKDIDKQLEIALVEIHNNDETGAINITRENISKAVKAIEIARDYLVKISNPKMKKDIGTRINEREDGVEKAKDELDIKDAEATIARADRAVEDFIRGSLNEIGEKETILTVTRLIESAETTISYIDHKSNVNIKKIYEDSLKKIKAKLNMDADEKNIFIAQDAINKATTEIIKSVEIMNNPESTETSIRNAIETARQAIESAEVAIEKVQNKVVKSILLNSIKEIKGLFESEKGFMDDSERIKNAERLLAAAEKSVREKSPSVLGDLTAAKVAIGVIQNKEIKDTLMRQWEDLNNGKVWGKDDINLIDQAERAVTKAEGSRLQKDVDSARKIVYQLKEEERKKALLDRLNTIEIIGISKPGDNGGGSGGKNPGDSKPGGSTGKVKEIVNDPLPVKDRDTSTPDPKWGDNKDLKKK